ncbi:hypothetical protein A3840_13580 [Devosia elaeis]|uniref:Uncharacterized protein n=1 Tax=Devosia elaeis TaxID=1770058 RepID=A0A178HTB5_9HYPH|nr:hypothetical protein A3840_13580 [Devosia elaeis]
MLFELFEPGLDVHQLSGLEGLLCVVVFCDPHDYVHHIRHAAGAFRATVQFGIDLGGHHELPRIGLEQIEHDVLDLLGADHIALADKHGGAGMGSQRGGINACHS